MHSQRFKPARTDEKVESIAGHLDAIERAQEADPHLLRLRQLLLVLSRRREHERRVQWRLQTAEVAGQCHQVFGGDGRNHWLLLTKSSANDPEQLSWDQR